MSCFSLFLYFLIRLRSLLFIIISLILFTKLTDRVANCCKYQVLLVLACLGLSSVRRFVCCNRKSCSPPTLPLFYFYFSLSSTKPINDLDHIYPAILSTILYILYIYNIRSFVNLSCVSLVLIAKTNWLATLFFFTLFTRFSFSKIRHKIDN